ncbi:MAG TPA: hypothetical protein VMN39_04660 [Longimicrobiaceae bacterium]|nr:hypothetical protein [Longimicrobiaceae bacterium]
MVGLAPHLSSRGTLPELRPSALFECKRDPPAGFPPAQPLPPSGAGFTNDTAALWARTIGFRPEMGGPEIYQAARLATLSGAPELRAQRLQLRSFRPLLRRLYPAAVPDA